MAVHFDDELRARIAGNLERFARRACDAGAGRPAAVAVVVLPDPGGEASVVLTLRASGLRRHGGQWACPGGRLDPGETPEAAALRELEEELGLRLPPDRILGLLDDFPTRSGFVITPVVVWGTADAVLRPDPGEVAGAYRVPLADLLDPANVVLQTIPQSDRPLLALAILDTLVYSPTAAVLHQFAEVAVRGRDVRVDGYEQPRFAWR
ncbi:MAG TPA: NUDIX domain-containing protein [Thermoanaerobaculia bacterium]|nr:NUDIX domain-containing protein [Thermoanaerobaculia bacterium]